MNHQFQDKKRPPAIRLRNVLVLLTIALAFMTFRIEHYSILDADTLSEERRASIRVLGLPVWFWRTSYRPGFPVEYEALSGRTIKNSRHWKRRPDCTMGILGGSGWRCGGMDYRHAERRRLLHALYQSFRKGEIDRQKGSRFFQDIEKLLPPERQAEKQADLEEIDRIRIKLGLPSRLSAISQPPE